ncbi:hypothetical protein B0T25DRAFT_512759 [Lasiosphaeria hispida]|uniref:Uncharacterized protein n=1 Tax=Lasiosphaeria hispida TaxID=260671 RepID=A0AAJ0MJ99_9PEZI|nr:hypothetical protein B0T25DRAFT_512759 [Lasiosphaeria hispida]
MGRILLAATFTTIVTLAFLNLWNLICFAALFIDGGKSRRRYAALVTIWNSKSPWGAVAELVQYTWSCARSHNGEGKADFLFSITFSILAFCVFASSVAMGIVTPSLMHIGSVAPVRPSAVFWPDMSNDGLDAFSARAPAFLRALGA